MYGTHSIRGRRWKNMDEVQCRGHSGDGKGDRLFETDTVMARMTPTFEVDAVMVKMTPTFEVEVITVL